MLGVILIHLVSFVVLQFFAPFLMSLSDISRITITIGRRSLYKFKFIDYFLKQVEFTVNKCDHDSIELIVLVLLV